jgi:hypothetical protein
MRWRVVVQVPRTTSDIAGFQPRSYVNGSQIWAHIRPIASASRYVAERSVGVVTHQVTFRKLAAFGVGYRFVLGARVFEALSFEECDGVPLFTRANCEEIQP